jgi:hypothetical protein
MVECNLSQQQKTRQIALYTRLLKCLMQKLCSDNRKPYDPRQPTKGSLIELGLEYLSSLQGKSLLRQLYGLGKRTQAC